MSSQMTTKQLLRELHGAIVLFLGEEDHEIPAPPRPKEERILFVGGLGTHPRVYHQLGQRIERHTGIHVEFPTVGLPMIDLNMRFLDEALDLLREEVRRLGRGKKIRALIGHSLGGIQATAMAEDFPEIPLIIPIGSPIWGTPWRPLQRFASQCLGFDASNPPERFQMMREHLSEYGERIVTVASPHDLIAPPESCAILGAKNIVLTARSLRRLELVNGSHPRKTVHSDCVSHDSVIRLIARELKKAEEVMVQ